MGCVAPAVPSKLGFVPRHCWRNGVGSSLFLFFCVVGCPPNWGKWPRYIDRFIHAILIAVEFLFSRKLYCIIIKVLYCSFFPQFFIILVIFGYYMIHVLFFVQLLIIFIIFVYYMRNYIYFFMVNCRNSFNVYIITCCYFNFCVAACCYYLLIYFVYVYV